MRKGNGMRSVVIGSEGGVGLRVIGRLWAFWMEGVARGSRVIDGFGQSDFLGGLEDISL